MEAQHKKRLQAICSWVEINASSIISQLADVVDEGLSATDNREALLEEVRSSTQTRVCNYLESGNAEKTEEPMVGFAYSLRKNEKEKLLSEAVQEVKKRGLLKNALKEMEKDEWPLSEDDRIVMLLSSPSQMPALQQVVNALLFIPLQGKKTANNKGKQQEAKAVQLPVQVVIEEDKIANVLLPRFSLRQRD